MVREGRDPSGESGGLTTKGDAQRSMGRQAGVGTVPAFVVIALGWRVGEGLHGAVGVPRGMRLVVWIAVAVAGKER